MKYAIILGATSGIGKELAKLLTEKGYMVGIAGRRTNLLLELQKEKPDSYFIKTMDIAETTSIVTKLDEMVQELGGLDLLFISSGTGEINEELDFPIEKLTIDTNVRGFTAAVDWAYHYFSKQGKGHIAAITSIAGLRGNRVNPSYSASKSYQMIYLESIRQKFHKSKLPVSVTDIRPGFVDTAMAKSDVKFWVASPEKASRQIYNAILSKRRHVYVTKRWTCIAYILKCMPGSLYWRL